MTGSIPPWLAIPVADGVALSSGTMALTGHAAGLSWCRSVDNQAPPRVWNVAESYPRTARYIGRSYGANKYSNPFIIGRDGDRDAVCDRFEREVLPTLDVSALRGCDLLCHCAPERCHGDSIVRKANA